MHLDGKPDVSTLARSGIFSVTNPSNDVCLVVKLEKVRMHYVDHPGIVEKINFVFFIQAYS